MTIFGIAVPPDSSVIQTAAATTGAMVGSAWPAAYKLKAILCPAAEKDNKKSWRQFAHSLHNKKNLWEICWATSANTELTWMELLGMTLHEVGHIIATEKRMPEHLKSQRWGHNPKTPEAVQAEADAVIFQLIGIHIYYNKRTLQYVKPEDVDAIFKRLQKGGV